MTKVVKKEFRNKNIIQCIQQKRHDQITHIFPDHGPAQHVWVTTTKSFITRVTLCTTNSLRVQKYHTAANKTAKALTIALDSQSTLRNRPFYQFITHKKFAQCVYGTFSRLQSKTRHLEEQTGLNQAQLRP